MRPASEDNYWPQSKELSEIITTEVELHGWPINITITDNEISQQYRLLGDYWR